MKYYLIAGEASGDLHGSNLMKEIKATDPKAEFRFYGGDLMKKQGGFLVKHYKEMAFMGLLEVLKNIRTLSKNIKSCKADVLEYNPDALIMIDYGGFNMKIAKFAKENKIPTHFYIAPKIWAWNEKRIHKIKKYIDYMYTIFSFEKPYFKTKHNHDVDFVGNPLLDEIKKYKPTDELKFRKENNIDTEKPIIAILPGSRKQEIESMLEIMLSISYDFEKYEFIIARAPSQPIEVYQKYIFNSNIKIVTDKTYDLLSFSTAALVTSGTATLETALFKVPEIVCYKTSWITYKVAKFLIKIDYLSLVNIIMDKMVVVELIQEDFNRERLSTELNKILDSQYRAKMFYDYYKLEEKLGTEGASKVTAKLIYKRTLQK
ncbi:MAG: lipid-A-disaccharide synthase [Flavobacteriaceae bacterium]|nr:lipid-A-disaccharide synthase [Flavobacteriaceae bacterium]